MVSLRAFVACTSLLLGFAAVSAKACANENRIRPWSEDPRYWQYEGKPVRLVGGSKDDNLFQIPDLEQHLDEIVAVGGNYVRNTMSDRPDGGWEVYPFARRDDGQYDLERWNDEYWNRFERFLKLTEERGIIVQIEVWDRFDYSRGPWRPHPYNPKNNINYTHEESGLDAEYPEHPGQNKQPFFYTVPELQNNETVLRFQRAQVDKMLSYALKHPHVLYCIDNETKGEEEWATYWAKHLRQRANEAGVDICITQMWDDWDVTGGRHLRTYNHPERYDFVDISQNTHNRGQQQWDNLMVVRRLLSDRPRPINHTKIYGADGGQHGGGNRDAVEKFWRNLIGGAASSRFHRPQTGLGLNELAKQQIVAFRMLEREAELFRCEPDAESRLLSNRQPNEAYLAYEPGQQYLLYFPKRGDVTLDVSQAEGTLRVRWLDVENRRWLDGDDAQGGGSLRLRSPIEGHALCLVTRR